LWLTQKAISELYNVDRTVITKHIQNIYSELELNENSTSAKFALVQNEGNREVKRNVQYYDLDILKNAGKISHEIACDKALTEFEKYRVKQDRLYLSDFDRLLLETENND